MIRHVILPLVGAGLASAAIAASSFGLVSALPQPTHGDRVGVTLLRYLERARGNGSRMSVGAETLRARCRRVSTRRSLITLSNGETIALKRTHITAWREARRPTTPVRRRAALRSAKADLAGSYRLYAAELAPRLLRGDDVVGGTTTFHGKTAYRIELADRPRVELIVDRDSIRPLGATFRSAHVHGTSSFLGSAENPGAGC